MPEVLPSVSPVLSAHAAACAWAADGAHSLQGWAVFGSGLHAPSLYEEAGWSLGDTGDTVAHCVQSLVEFTPP